MNKKRKAYLDSVIPLLPKYDPYRDAGECWFDYDEAWRRLAFFRRFLTHVKGKLAGQPFDLEPHERSIVANIFGWKRPDGTRRYREVLVFIPRKNDKSTLCAGLTLCALHMDREPGGEFYSTGGDKDQAGVVFKITKKMTQKSPHLRARSTVYADHIEVSDSVYMPVSAKPEGKHGYDVHVAVNDELHTHKTPELIEVIRTGTGARSQPLVIHITTADFDREGSICNELHDYAVRVRDGDYDDPAFLPVIYEVSAKDLEDDPECWKDPETWAKANPMLGKSISLEYLQRECARAQESPAYENTFKRLHLNIRTESQTRLLKMDNWDKLCGGELDITKYHGKQAVGAGLDLGNTSDLTALCLLFDREFDDGAPREFDAFWWHWTPRVKAEERQRQDRGANYTTWARAGWMELTEGNETDYAHIRKRINEIADDFGIPLMAIDRLFQGAQLSQDLAKDGLNIEEFGQGFYSMAAPTSEFVRLVNSGRIHHGDNALMRWQAANLQGEMNAAGSIKPCKARSGNKIDGAVACIMALGLAMKAEPPQSNWFDTHSESTFVSF